MIKATFVLILCSFATFAQKNLTLQKNQVVQIRTNVDVLTLDTLVMKDSSMLIIGGRKNMFLQVNHLFVGSGCIVEGRGKDGKNGDNLPYTGAPNVRNARVIRGDGGWAGGHGTNLFITIKDLTVRDTLTIFVPGGKGGNGTPAPTLNVLSSRPGVSTSSYNAMNPYDGLPGFGGNGGRGGNVAIAYSPSIENRLNRIVIINKGGQSGEMGDINPSSLIPLPMSVLDPQARLNDPMYVRNVRRDGRPGKVKWMKLVE